MDQQQDAELTPTTMQHKKIEDLISGIKQMDLRWENAKNSFEQAMKNSLMQAFGMDPTEPEPTEEEKEEVLEYDTSIKKICQNLKANKYKNIIIMAGAGISVSAGIMDFRTPGTGLYDNLQKYNLPTPQSIFTLDYFEEKPDAFYQLAKELWPGNYKATPTHHFIKMLHDKKVLLRCYTQNIDGLERQAGVPADKIVEAHGNFFSAHCICCEAEHDINVVRNTILQGQKPKCHKCGTDKGWIKPDIVFFGESLPARYKELNEADFAKCDLLLIMGTSLAVNPFATLINKVKKTVPRVLLNREVVEQFEHFKDDTNYRDVVACGDCDSSVLKMQEMIGWTKKGATTKPPVATTLTKAKKDTEVRAVLQPVNPNLQPNVKAVAKPTFAVQQPQQTPVKQVLVKNMTPSKPLATQQPVKPLVQDTSAPKPSTTAQQQTVVRIRKRTSLK